MKELVGVTRKEDERKTAAEHTKEEEEEEKTAAARKLSIVKPLLASLCKCTSHQYYLRSNKTAKQPLLFVGKNQYRIEAIRFIRPYDR